MNETLQGALIGLIGTIVGAGISFLLQLYLDCKNNKRENRRITYQLKIETYADAIRYISLCCSIFRHEKDDNCELENDEEQKLYNKFHPVFTILAPRNVIIKYNDLRNSVLNGRIQREEAYKKVVEILDFNISNEINYERSYK